MNLDYDYILVGAGFFCSVIAERLANDSNKRVLVIDKRDHIGGNCHSQIHSETQIEYHTYGTHIFHTSNKEVWNYISQFTEFNSYYHQVLTTYNGKVYQLPINLETINAFYNVSLKPFEVDEFLEKEIAKTRVENPQNFEEVAINTIGKPLYEAFIKGYTIKQWETDPKNLPAHIFKRLPFRKNYSESYFFDTHQGIPLEGYTKIFEGLLESDQIDVELNVDFHSIKDQIKEDTTIIYSGSIDSLLDYKYGELDYRTLKFDLELKDYQDHQGTSVMNYSNTDIPFTRIHEPKHLHPERKSFHLDKTLIIKEYSQKADREYPYYPIGGDKNRELYQKYLEEVNTNYPNIIVGGRLGDYRYYDMDNVIEKALNLYYSELKN